MRSASSRKEQANMTRIEKYEWLKAWFIDHREAMESQPSMVALIRANSTARNYIHDLYFALLNKTLAGCSQCEADALLFLMMKKTEETMKKIVECRFKLKQGVLLQGAKGLPMVTCANLTDELAIAYLKDNPKRADKFAFIPDGWDAEETTEQPIEEVTEKAEETTEQSAESVETSENIVENNEMTAESVEIAQIAPENNAEVEVNADAEKGAENENNAENSAPTEEKPKRTRKPRTTKK